MTLPARGRNGLEANQSEASGGVPSIPSNNLASIYGLLAECDERKVLGPNVDIEIDACDECNTVVNVECITRETKKAGGGFVGHDARIASPRRRVRLPSSLTLTLSHLTRNNARGQVAPATSIQVG